MRSVRPSLSLAASPRRRWSLRELLAAACFMVVLSLQLGVPLVRLLGERPARFGWQMFSTSSPPVRYYVRTDRGLEREVGAPHWVVADRVEIDYLRLLPAHLCRQLPQAVAVRAVGGKGAPPLEQPCP